MKSRNLFQLLLKVFAVSFDFALASFVLSTITAGLAVVQGQQQQQIAKANAARLNMQAERERQAANRNAQIAAQRRKRERAQATAAYAASGVLIDEGSPLIVEAEDDYRSEINEATGFRTRSQAQIEAARGQSALTQGYGRAFGSLASGASLLAPRPKGT